MMIPLKYSQNGNSLCIMLTKEAASALKAVKGDVVYLTDGPEGAKVLTAYNPDFERQMALARKGMSEYRDALRELAKR